MVIFLLALFCAKGAEPLRISTTAMPVAAPLHLANELGLFKKAGLQVEILPYSLGKLAVEDLAEGKLDIACAAVTPLVTKFMAGQKFKIIATMSSSTGMVALVARKDLGINTIADIKGRRVGIAKGTSGEFFFETLRILNRIPRTAITIEDHSLEEIVAGFKNGTLDVVSTWEPQINELVTTFPNRIQLFYGNGLYTFNWNVVAKAETIARRRPDLEKLLTAINEAAVMIEKDPEEAGRQLVEHMGARGRDLSLDLPAGHFGLQLTQELLVQMEAEARWIINRDGNTNALPNFLRCIDSSVLKKIRPAAVTLIE